jgi:hypothetical protein
MEIANIMSKIRTGYSNLIPDDLVGVYGDIGGLISGWERNVTFKIMSYEEALGENPIVAQWISFARNAALDSHTYIRHSLGVLQEEVQKKPQLGTTQ